MKILRILFLTNAAIAGSMLLNSCKGVPEDMPPISGLQAYVKASNTGAADDFGFAVALSSDGNTLAVGAPGEASAGLEADNSAPSAGAVYVYTRSGTTWTQQAYIKASNAEAGDQFGFAVALSSDGNTLAVGAPGEASAASGNPADNTAANAGAVYVFTRNVATWTQDAYVKASTTGAGDQFGFAVALSGDGNTLAVGAPGEASAVSGNPADNTAANAGAVYVFTGGGTTWTQQAYIKASNTGAEDQFGISVALSSNGNTLAVSATGEDSALTGVTAGIVTEGTAGNAAPGAGAVYVFTRIGTAWTQEAYVKASNTGAGDQFGFSVALSSNGNTLAVGAIGEDSSAIGIGGSQTDSAATTNAGAVYVYTRSGTTWTQEAYVKASNTGALDLFGFSVSLSGDGNTLAVGAIGESSAATGIGGSQTDNSAADAGAAYVFTRSISIAATWAQQVYVKASNTGSGDHFGTSAALSSDGTTLAVGATGEDSSATGIGGSQTDNSAAGAGAVYVFIGSSL